MKLFKFIWQTCKQFKQIIYGMLFCTLLVAIDSNLRPYLIKLIINQANFSWPAYGILAFAYIFLQIGNVIVMATNDWLGTKLHTNYRKMISYKYLDKLTSYPYSFFQETQSGVITAKITDAFNTIFVTIYLAIDKFIRFLLVVLVTLIILSTISYVFALAALIWVFIFLGVSHYFYRKYEPINREYAKCRPKIFGFFADYFSNILSVWNFASKKYERSNFSKIIDDWFNQATEAGKFLWKIYMAQGLILVSYMAFLVLYLGHLRNHGLITLGDYALVFMVNFKISDLLFDISMSSSGFVTNLGVIRSAVELLEKTSEMADKPDAKELKIKQASINFEQVNFNYTDSKTLFDKLSIEIKPLEKVGLIGYSGSGKTSFVSLILRLYEINGGQILIDGQNISDVTRDSLRKNIGIIPQDPMLFNRSLMENIRYGNLEASDEEVIKASQAAKAHDFIYKLNDGYDTLVGERGIAIARAILKAAPILILDEATSQLDSLTENDIQESLLPLMNKSTTLAVAHRLSTLIHMDRIIVFDDGKIVEDGAHAELLSKAGLYKSMWEAQVGGFLPEKKI
jgi:ATP-binding cassette subfamily B protein